MSAVVALEAEKLLSVADVAAALHVQPRTVRRWIKAGDLVAVKFRGKGKLLIRADQLELQPVGES